MPRTPQLLVFTGAGCSLQPANVNDHVLFRLFSYLSFRARQNKRPGRLTPVVAGLGCGLCRVRAVLAARKGKRLGLCLQPAKEIVPSSPFFFFVIPSPPRANEESAFSRRQTTYGKLVTVHESGSIREGRRTRNEAKSGS
jgi:hypothetical protein